MLSSIVNKYVQFLKYNLFIVFNAMFLVFFLIFSFLCSSLDYAGHLVSFSAHVNIPYRIVRYDTGS